MRPNWLFPALACVALAACMPPRQPEPPAPTPAGWMRVSDQKSRTIACGELPILVDISHASITLAGRCGYVRVTGEHLDLIVELIPGGTVDVTGAHDDIFWKVVGPGPKPSLLNRGGSNSFHPPIE